MQRINIEISLREIVFFRHHLRAGKLAELHVGVALLHSGTHVAAQAIFFRQRRRGEHGHARHAFHAASDHDIHRTRHHRLRSKMQRLLR